MSLQSYRDSAQKWEIFILVWFALGFFLSCFHVTVSLFKGKHYFERSFSKQADNLGNNIFVKVLYF
jgi:hypothetical protein